MIKRISLILIIIIMFSSVVFACQVSVPASLLPKNIIKNDNVLFDSYQNSMNVTNSPKISQIYSLNVPDDRTNIVITVDDEIFFDGHITESVNDLHLYYSPLKEFNKKIHGENFNQKAGESLKRYDDSIVKIFYDEVLVAEYQLRFQEAKINYCPPVFPESYLFIFGTIVVLIIATALFFIIRKIRHK